MNFKLLKNKDFSLLMMGKLVSLLGSNMLQFALSLYVLAITGSALIFASMLAISILPRLIFSPIAGVFGDWFDRKKVIVALDFFNGLIIGAFALIFVFNGGLSLLLIYIFVILLETVEIFFGSAMAAVIPSMVEKDDLLAANSLQSLVMNFGQLLAPSIAAIVYGFTGMLVVLIVTSVLFVLSAISEMFINIPKQTKQTVFSLASFKTDFIEGLKIVKSSKFILTILGLVAIINFTISPLFSVGMTFVVKEILKASDFQFGLFQTIFAVASISAPLVLGMSKGKKNIGRLLFRSFLFLSFVVLALAIIPSDILLAYFAPNIIPFLLLLVMLFFVGFLVTTINITLSTIFSQIVPLEAMSRVSSVLTLASTILIPLGQLAFGFLFDNLAASYVIIICGLILIGAVLIYRRRLLSIANHLEEENHNEVPVSA